MRNTRIVTSQKLHLISCHGWAMPAHSLDAIHAAIARSFGARIIIGQRLDLGYFCTPQAFTPQDDQVLLLGHSYGFVHLLELARRYRLVVRAAVSLGGFLRFPAAPAEIRALRKSCVRQTAPTIDAFYARAGYKPPHELQAAQLDAGALIRDLDLLASTTVSPPAFPILALHAAADGVVPLAAAREWTAACSQAVLKVHPAATHALGIDEANWCTEQLGAFLHDHALLAPM